MKKLLLLFATGLMLMTNVSQGQDSKLFAGKWKCCRVKNASEVGACKNEWFYNLKADGTYIRHDSMIVLKEKIAHTGTWIIKGNILELNEDENRFTIGEIPIMKIPIKIINKDLFYTDGNDIPPPTVEDIRYIYYVRVE